MNKTVYARQNSDNSICAYVVFSPNRPLNQYGMYFKNPAVNPGSGTWYETIDQAIRAADETFERMVKGYGSAEKFPWE